MARDYSKFSIQDLGENFNKGQLVYQVVSSYVKDYAFRWDEIKNVFPDNIQGSLGIVRQKSDIKDFKRYSKQSITSIDKVEFYVCNQWGDNISKFVALATDLGYEISKSGNSDNDTKSSEESETTYLEVDIEVWKDNGSLICSIKNFKCDVSGDNSVIKDGYDALLEKFSSSVASRFIASEIIGRLENDIYIEMLNNSIPSGSEYGTTVDDLKSPDYNWYEECPHLVVTRVGGIDLSPIVKYDEDDDQIVENACRMMGVDNAEVIEDMITDYFVDARWSVDESMIKDLL